MRAITLVIILILSFASSANDFSKEIKLADNVVQGRVMSKSSEWVDGKVVTYHQVLVRDDLMAGALGKPAQSELVITQAGGTAVHPVLKVAISQTISHQVTLKEGDEAIFFTHTDPLGQQQLVKGQNSVVAVQGMGTDNVVLPAFKQLKVSKSSPQHANVLRAKQTTDTVGKAVLQQEALTLPNAKARIKQLLADKLAKQGKDDA